MKNVIKKIDGKKTITSVVLYLLLETIKTYRPGWISAELEHLLTVAINTGLIVGIAHKGIKYIKEKINSRKAKKANNDGKKKRIMDI